MWQRDNSGRVDTKTIDGGVDRHPFYRTIFAKVEYPDCFVLRWRNNWIVVEKASRRNGWTVLRWNANGWTWNSVVPDADGAVFARSSNEIGLSRVGGTVVNGTFMAAQVNDWLGGLEVVDLSFSVKANCKYTLVLTEGNAWNNRFVTSNSQDWLIDDQLLIILISGVHILQVIRPEMNFSITRAGNSEVFCWMQRYSIHSTNMALIFCSALTAFRLTKQRLILWNTHRLADQLARK